MSVPTFSYAPPLKWPVAPKRWSISTQSTIEQCPRRWALSNATYGAFKDPGYPSQPSFPSIRGQVLHSVVEKVMGALNDAGCERIQSACGVKVLQHLGGLRLIIQAQIHEVLTALEDNPRAKPLVEPFRRKLFHAIGEFTERSQAILLQVKLHGRSRSIPRTDEITVRSKRKAAGSLRNGTYTEVWLEVPALNFGGRADLILVTEKGAHILDFKTGSPVPSHVDQLQIYGLLWLLDTVRNPSGLPPVSLGLVYSSESIEVPIPDNWDMVQDALMQKTEACQTALKKAPPEAKPSLEQCPFCHVRALCNAYWSSDIMNGNVSDQDSGFTDVEVEVLSQRSSSRWICRVTESGQLRHDQHVYFVAHKLRSLNVGDRLRLLDVRWAKPTEDDGLMVITEGNWSECYTRESS